MDTHETEATENLFEIALAFQEISNVISTVIEHLVWLQSIVDGEFERLDVSFEDLEDKTSG